MSFVNEIISAVSEALFDEFGDGYEIYTESIEQGFHTPCFSIACIQPSNALFRGKRYFCTNRCTVHYFPSEERKNAQCNEVCERLFDCLAVIVVAGDPLRGTKLNGAMEDGVLVLHLNYNLFVDQVSVTETMDSYACKTTTKGE